MSAAMDRCEELEQAFLAFHWKHPEVWREFVKLTRRLISRGFEHYSHLTICEVIRYHTDAGAAGQGGKGFKINNNYRAFYGRVFAAKYPEHADLFRFRRMTTQDRPATGRPDTPMPDEYGDWQPSAALLAQFE